MPRRPPSSEPSTSRRPPTGTGFPDALATAILTRSSSMPGPATSSGAIVLDASVFPPVFITSPARATSERSSASESFNSSPILRSAALKISTKRSQRGCLASVLASSTMYSSVASRLPSLLLVSIPLACANSRTPEPRSFHALARTLSSPSAPRSERRPACWISCRKRTSSASFSEVMCSAFR